VGSHAQRLLLYYQTQNVYNDGGTLFLGVNVCAYEGRAMRAGGTAQQICIHDNTILPADNDYNNVDYEDYDSAATQPEVLCRKHRQHLPTSRHFCLRVRVHGEF
jgi:hypothetical protein